MKFLLLFLALIGTAAAQPADSILLDGKVLVGDDPFSIREAVAVRDGRILALGRSADLKKLAGRQTLVVDLQGRTVIPGLIDSRMHAIRAALSFATEVNWIGAASLEEALGRDRRHRVAAHHGGRQGRLRRRALPEARKIAAPDRNRRAPRRPVSARFSDWPSPAGRPRCASPP